MADSNHKEGEWWSENKRIEVVTTWLALGKIPLVAACTKVPEGTIRQWRTQPWWKELELSIQTESDQELDAKLAKRIDKALDVVWDRLENGDFMYDPKLGEFVRKPVGLKDVNKVMVDMMDKRLLIRKQPKEMQSQEAVKDILTNLAKEFASMARAKAKTLVPSDESSDSPEARVKEKVTDGEIPVSSDTTQA
jgi:glutamine synthetase